MKIWIRKIIILLLLLPLITEVLAADLPSKGKKPPTDIYGAPGPLPPGPGAPVGGGLLLLLGFAAAYGIKKYKDNEQD